MSEDKFSSGLNDFLSVTDSNEDDEMMEAPPVKKKAKAEKPKSEPKPAEKVQEPKDERKASEKDKNTTKKDGAKTYCLRLSPEAIDKIDTYKHILGMTAGEFVATSIQCWEENTPQIVNIVKQVKDAKKKLNI